MYSYSRLRLEDQVRTLIDNYNRAAVDFATYKGQQGLTKANEKTVNTFLAAHPEHADEKTIKWSSSLKSRAARGGRLSPIVAAGHKVVTCGYVSLRGLRGCVDNWAGG